MIRKLLVKLGVAMERHPKEDEGYRYVRSLAGCNSMFRRQDIIDAGGFSTEVAEHLQGGQDLELCTRLRKLKR